MRYELDISLLGKKAKCSTCRKKFTLERVSETLALGPKQAEGLLLGEDKKSSVLLESSNEGSGASTSTKIWSVGDVVLGTYEVKAISPGVSLAQGGAGIVQRVYHREWDRDLAVKSPKPDVLQSEGGIAHYERECQTWVELGLHPNIVACYLVRRIDGVPRIFAEFVPDGSLRDWTVDGRIYTGGPEVSLQRILDIAIQFAWGLDYAHQRGLLHLDVKPANVMMSGSSPKVADFGLAQAITAVNKEAALSGEQTSSSYSYSTPKWEGMTPAYCSPEQYRASVLFREGKIDPKLKMTFQSDIWSWAISILSLFHGLAPCRRGGQTAAKVFEMFLKSPVPEDRPTMPPGLIELLRHCFQEDPKNRPRSFSEIAERLIGIYKMTFVRAYPRTEPKAAQWTLESINNRAASLLDLNKPKEAVKLLYKTLQSQPGHTGITYNHALLQWRRAEIIDQEAIARSEILLKTKADASNYFALGLLQRERGSIALAIENFENALEQEEPRPEIVKALTATHKFRARDVRCIERFSTLKARERAAFLNDTEDRLLIAVDPERFVLCETLTGRKILTLNRSRQNGGASSDSPWDISDAILGDVFDGPKPGDRIALSEDFQWELLQTKDAQSLLLKNASGKGESFLVYGVPWGGTRKTIQAPVGAASELISDAYAKIFPPSEQMAEREIQFAFDEQKVLVLDVRTGNVLAELIGHEDVVQSVDISSDGRWIATGSKDKTIRIWEFPGGRCVRTLQGQDLSVDALCFSRSRSFLLSFAAGQALRIWDVDVLCNHSDHLHAPIMLSQVASSEEISRQQNETSSLQQLVVSAVRSGDFDTVLETLQKMRELPTWNTVRKEIPWEEILRHCVREKLSDAVCTRTLLGHEDGVSSVLLSLDGKLAVSASRDQSLRIWSLPSGNCVRVIKGHQDWIRGISMTADARYLLSGSWDTSVRIWSTGSGKCVRVLDDKVRSISKVMFHPQAKTALIGTATGALLCWDVVANRNLGSWTAHQGEIRSIAYTRDGHYFVTAGEDATVKIWESSSCRLIHSFSRGKAPVASARFALGDRSVVSVLKDGTIEVRELENERNARVFGDHLADVFDLEMTPDGRFLITASKDQSLKIWNTENGLLQKTIPGHSGAVNSVVVDFSGMKMLSGSDDGSLRTWDLFWDFSLPSGEMWDKNAEPVLQSLLSNFCEDETAGRPPALEPTDIERILLEMEFRGFGWIPREKLQNSLEILLGQWSGPPRILPPNSR